jgi:hypothetical protein
MILPALISRMCPKQQKMIRRLSSQQQWIGGGRAPMSVLFAKSLKIADTNSPVGLTSEPQMVR